MNLQYIDLTLIKYHKGNTFDKSMFNHCKL